MSRHDGVSCDVCLRNNFAGVRYKCLVCYDYDLCGACCAAGASSARHSPQHAVQCILTREDYELFYRGETLSAEHSQSLTCPFCARTGFSVNTLAEHVTTQHSDSTAQVVCPVCASIPSGEPNHVTEDLASHLNVDHRAASATTGIVSNTSCNGSGGRHSRELMPFGDESSAAAAAMSAVAALRHSSSTSAAAAARRAPHSSRNVAGARMRRFNTHFRESMDPIAELLSQLSGVRRVASSVSAAAAAAAAGGVSGGVTSSSSSSSSSVSATRQLQQLHMHLQMEHQQQQQQQQQPPPPIHQYSQVVREAVASRRQITFIPNPSVTTTNTTTLPPPHASSGGVTSAFAGGVGLKNSGPRAANEFLLSSLDDEQSCSNDSAEKLDKATFVQELVLHTLTKSFDDCLAKFSPSNVSSAVASSTTSSITNAGISKPAQASCISSSTTSLSTSSLSPASTTTTTTTTTHVGVQPSRPTIRHQPQHQHSLTKSTATAASSVSTRAAANNRSSANTAALRPRVVTVASTGTAGSGNARRSSAHHHQETSSACSGAAAAVGVPMGRGRGKPSRGASSSGGSGGTSTTAAISGGGGTSTTTGSSTAPVSAMSSITTNTPTSSVVTSVAPVQASSRR